MTKEQIENFKELHRFFYTIAEDIAEKFSKFFEIYADFTRIRLGDNYITITYCQHSYDYYDGEDEIDYIVIDYNKLLLGKEKIIEKLIKERQQEVELEKEQQQKEFQNELELYNKLKKEIRTKI